MRFPSLASLLGVAAIRGATAAATTKLPEPTTFDGITVPPLLELTPKTYSGVINQTKFVLLKNYSPYCPHCTHFAPAFQTTYEFYYTEKAPGESEVATFSSHYNFTFATLNCVAFFDLCSSIGIKSYPTTILYKDGKEVVALRGVKNVTTLSNLVEDALDKEYPGTRTRPTYLPKDKAVSRAVPAEDSKDASATGAKDAKASGTVADNKSAKASGTVADTKDTKASGAAAPAQLHKDAADTKDAKDAKSSGAVVANKDAKAPEAVIEKAKEEVKPSQAAPIASAAPVPAAVAAPAAAAVAGELVKDTKEDAKGQKGKTAKKTSPSVYTGPPKSTATPNANGMSVALTAETFQKLVTTTQDPWFIKFYAPWCHHCQALAPTWEQLSKEMKGKLNIGEVNCEKEKRLCKDVKLQGYPTILFFRGGERVEYDGLRGLGDFVQYADKAVEICGGVRDVNADEFRALEEKEEVIFLYFYDFATTTEDFMALDRLPLSLIGHAKLVKTNDPELYDRFKITTWPRLVVSREGRPTYYSPLTPKEMRDTTRVLAWMRSVWLPIVPEMTATNAREIMDGKLVVLGILKREDQEGFASAIREMKSAASEWMDKQIQLFQLERQELRDTKQLRIEEAQDRNDQRALRAAKSIRINMDKAGQKEVSFAWVDGVFWQRWVRTTYGLDVKDGERVIINDEDNRRYWDQTITGNAILPSRTSILETLNKVTATPPKIKPKLTISALEKVFFDIRMTFSEHPYLSIGCVLGMSLGVASWFRGRGRRVSARGHSDSVGMRDFKMPILGSVGTVNSNGKTD